MILKLCLKSLKSIPILIWILISISIITIFSINYSNNATTYDYNFSPYSVEKYDKIEEIDNLIVNARNKILALDEDNDYYLENKQILLDAIRIYEYLKDNKIQYSDVMESQVNRYSDNKADFFKETEGVLLIISLIFAIICIYVVFTSDFDNGVNKILYQKSRTSIIMKKFASVMILLFVYSVLMYIMVSIFSISFETNKASFIVLDKNRIYLFSPMLFTFIYSIFFPMLRVFEWAIIAFIIAVAVRNSLLTVVAQIVFFGLLYASGYLSNVMIQIMGAPLILNSFNVSYMFFFITRIMVYLVITIAFLGSIYLFNRRDIK